MSSRALNKVRGGSAAGIGADRFGFTPAITPTTLLANANRIALQKAMDYASSNFVPLLIPPSGSGKAYYVAPASTNVNTNPYIFKTTGHLRMVGVAGAMSTLIQGINMGVGQAILGVDATGGSVTNFEGMYIGGLNLYCESGLANNDQRCMMVKDISQSVFEDIILWQCAHGIAYTGTRCFSNVFHNLRALGTTSSTFFMTSHIGGGHHIISDSAIGGQNGIIIDQNTVTDHISVVDTNMEACLLHGLYCAGSVVGLDLKVRTEACGGSDIMIQSASLRQVRGLRVRGTFTKNTDNTLPCVQLALQSGGLITKGIDISLAVQAGAGGGYAGNMVAINGSAADGGSIHDSFLDGPLASCSPYNVLPAGMNARNNSARDGSFANA